MIRQLRLTMIASAAVACAAWLPVGAHANMLLNPGFETEDMSGGAEDGLTGSVAAANWVQFRGTGARAERNDSMPLSGDWDLVMQTASDTSGFAGAYQQVNIAEGVNYTFSVWAKVDDLADGTPGLDDSGDLNSEARMRIEWRNDTGEISRDQINITSGLTSSYQLISLSAVAPTGAIYARPVIALNANNDAFYFDDATFQVPEPVSSGLLLLGATGLAFRKRRSA